MAIVHTFTLAYGKPKDEFVQVQVPELTKDNYQLWSLVITRSCSVYGLSGFLTLGHYHIKDTDFYTSQGLSIWRIIVLSTQNFHRELEAFGFDIENEDPAVLFDAVKQAFAVWKPRWETEEWETA